MPTEVPKTDVEERNVNFLPNGDLGHRLESRELPVNAARSRSKLIERSWESAIHRVLRRCRVRTSLQRHAINRAFKVSSRSTTRVVVIDVQPGANIHCNAGGPESGVFA